jgi:hypothetical protein
MSRLHAAVFCFVRFVLMKPESWKHYQIMQNILAAEVLPFVSEQGSSHFAYINSLPLPKPWEQGVCYICFQCLSQTRKPSI